MKIAEKLKATDKTLFSFEIVPPLKGNDIKKLYEKLDLLVEFNPLNINITYHQDEIVYSEDGKGVITKSLVRKHPGTVALAAAIKNRYHDIETVPHLICGGMSKQDIENTLIDLNFLGIENILALRGDAPKGSRYFVAEKNGHSHTDSLVKQIIDLNNGIYLDKNLKNNDRMNFSIGVAGYPEKHIEAPNDDYDMKYLKQKVDAGAQYIVTQMFFDNEKFFSWEKRCREAGITCPIIPAIKPIGKLRDIQTIPQVFNIDLPSDLVSACLKAKDDSEIYKIGIEWTIQQSRDLIAHKVPCVHYFSVGRTENVREVAKAVF
ncbi:MAG: methylenetetrahydrofolate reductase [Bacteroidales bacterium]|nr:methylenetetrahydrofolate reductase [Bacteroidales bacterium]